MWSGLVFAGGESRRMGRDKALLTIAGRTLLERAVATIREAGGAPLVLGPRREGAGLERVRFIDETADGGMRIGPLGALRHGLRACETRVAVALACDLPLVPSRFLAFLAGEAASHTAVVPRARGELQVLAAAYTRSCLEAIERRVESGRLSVHGFLDEVDARLIESEELALFGGEPIFLNVNSPEDLVTASRILAESRP
ncbi:MAG TPA: molybdenum cofactor guanylyltransferase [Candidatus Polarisedimenticolia bacterium]|nr:molybdenum cofactor guanylyltransferase [Candidatus Polarisedimenticolia bacterium]